MRHVADAEQLNAEQQRALELVASGRPMQECLNEVTSAVSRLASGVRACVLMATPARDAIAGVWSATLPPTFSSALRGAPLAETPIGSCAETIRTGRVVACSDIARDARWTPIWRDLCLAHGIRACQSTPIFDAVGRPSGSFFICLDDARELTAWERRLAEFGAHIVSVVCARDLAADALRRSEERLDVLSKSVPALISYVDTQRRYVSCNAEYTKWFGLSQDEIVGRRMQDVLGEEAWKVTGPRIDAALAGETVQYEAEAHYRVAGTRWMHAVYIPHVDDRGGVVGVIVLVTDIGARKQADIAKARLAAIVNSSDDAIVGKTLDGTITSWNDGATRLFGYAASEALGRHITLLIPDDRHDEERQILASMRRGETLRIPETKRRRNDGSLVDVSLVVSPVVDDDGQVVGASKIARDITARLAIERQQRRHYDAVAELVERAPFGIYIVDDQFRIVQMNDGSRTGAFANVNPVIGRDFAEAIHVLWPDAVASEIVSWFQNTLATGEPYQSRGFIKARRDIGTVESYEWDLHRITMPDGRHGVVCYFFDSTRLRHAEQALREADRRKDEFLATLAHELRNPLAPIRNSLHILRSDIEAHVATRVHDMMERQVTHLVRLVDDLMEVSRITRGKIELRREEVDLSAALHSALETSRPLIETARHQLTVTFPVETLVVDADPVRLAQIFANLLNNAAKYANPGSCIDLQARREGSDAVVSVRDTGIGIPAEMLDKVFDLFTQVDRTYDRAQSGLGIGLTLVRSLVTMHGGSVAAHSEGAGKGSEFVVRIPLAAQGPIVTPSRRIPAQSRRASALRILVVDDNTDAADSLALLLQSLGATVHIAHDGPTALYALETWKPSLIFLDIGLPVMDGFTVAQRIRATVQGQHVTVVALTGWGNEDDRRRSREVGIDLHLVKPVDFSVLSQILDQLLPSGRTEALEFAASKSEGNGV